MIHIIGGNAVGPSVGNGNVRLKQGVIQGGGYLADAAAGLKHIFLTVGDAIGLLPAVFQGAFSHEIVKAPAFPWGDHATIDDPRSLLDVEHPVFNGGGLFAGFTDGGIAGRIATPQGDLLGKHSGCDRRLYGIPFPI